MLDQENRFVQVDVDGRVTYNRRLTLTLACNMNLLRYIIKLFKKIFIIFLLLFMYFSIFPQKLIFK